MSGTQFAKAVAGFPHLLGYSVECNLKPTVQCLRELGSTDTQVAKAAAGYPSFLGFSVANNLKVSEFLFGLR